MNVLYKSRNWFGRQAGTISLTKSDLEIAAACIDCSSEGMEEGRICRKCTELHRLRLEACGLLSIINIKVPPNYMPDRSSKEKAGTIFNNLTNDKYKTEKGVKFIYGSISKYKFRENEVFLRIATNARKCLSKASGWQTRCSKLLC